MNQTNISGTKEWAESNANIAKGCEHDCHYCYAKAMAIRFKRTTSKDWRSPAINNQILERKIKKRQGRIMFPTTHDITPFILDSSVQFIRKNIEVGNSLLIVSKPHYDCIKKICDTFNKCKANIVFRFTIGSASDDTLKLWEPYAPNFSERLKCLKYAYKKGFETSISCEPMLDDRIDRVIDKVLPYVTNSIWLGKVNRLNSTLGTNKVKDKTVIKAADNLIRSQNDESIQLLYDKYKNNSMIRWKESIKKVVGIELNTVAGTDK